MRSVSLVLIFIVATMATASDNKEKKFYDLANANSEFEKFIKDFNKEYKDEDDKKVHFEAFVENLKKINELNEKSTSATYGINKFADYTEDEKKNMRGLKRPE